MADKTSDNASNAQVRVHFSTRSPDIALPADPGPILVPTNLRRAGLSSILNHLLAISPTSPTPFDILISGQFLRTDLDTYLTDHGVSQETTLQLEYIRALPPPIRQTGFQHDDWIAAVKVLPGKRSQDASGDQKGPRMLTGSYDGLLRMYDAAGTVVGTSRAVDAAPLQAVKFLAQTAENRIAAASMSGDIVLQSMKSKLSADGKSQTVVFKPLLRLKGHEQQISSLNTLGPKSDLSSTSLLSTSTSGHVAIWDLNATPSTEEPSERPAKRRKSSSTQLPTIAPIHISQTSTQPFTACVASASQPLAYATTPSSLDTLSLSTLRSTTSRPLPAHPTCILALNPSNLLAIGTTNKSILLVDPRTDSSRILAGTLRGHTNIVSCLAAGPESGAAYGGAGGTVFASGAHDGTVKIWDLRGESAETGTGGRGGAGEKGGDQSVYTVVRRSGRRGVKVLGVDWEEEVGIVSGGTDCLLQVDGWRDGGVVKGDD